MTTFKFKVNQASNVILRIYAAHGTLVATPFSGPVQEGEFETEWNAANLPSGIYMAQLFDSNGRLLQTGKLIKSR